MEGTEDGERQRRRRGPDRTLSPIGLPPSGAHSFPEPSGQPRGCQPAAGAIARTAGRRQLPGFVPRPTSLVRRSWWSATPSTRLRHVRGCHLLPTAPPHQRNGVRCEPATVGAPHLGAVRPAQTGIRTARLLVGVVWGHRCARSTIQRPGVSDESGGHPASAPASLRRLRAPLLPRSRLWSCVGQLTLGAWVPGRNSPRPGPAADRKGPNMMGGAYRIWRDRFRC